ncbi:DUF502 domain-containing protein, partial [bacterium]|nr:DUF502 domain-containing protein [bacterium]
TGILVIVPFSLTVYILYILFNWLDELLLPLLKLLNQQYNIPVFKGFGIIALIIIIFVIGIFTKNIFGKSLLNLLEKIINSLPIIKNIYGTTKDISNAFLGTAKNKIFKKVVLVDYPKEGTKVIGFMTNEYTFLDSDKEDFISVFIPTTPNPTSGFYLIYKKDEVKILDMSIEEALKNIISAGAVDRPKKKK